MNIIENFQLLNVKVGTVPTHYSTNLNILVYNERMFTIFRSIHPCVRVNFPL